MESLTVQEYFEHATNEAKEKDSNIIICINLLL